MGGWEERAGERKSPMQPIVTPIGLVLNMVGVIFIFIWGPPMSEMEGSVMQILFSRHPMEDISLQE